MATLSPLFRRIGSMAGAFALLMTTFVSAVESENSWPQFRGPDGNGITAASYPVEWGQEENMAWSTEIPGGGWSSPVVSGGRIFVTSAVSPDDVRPKGWGDGVSSMRSFFQSKPPSKPLSFQVHCLNLESGDLLWSKQVVSRKPSFKIHPSNSYATESPIVDGNRVYAYFAAIGAVACLDSDGEIVWQKEVGEFPTSSDFGTGSSLAMLDDKLFIQCDNEKKSFVCALEAETGEELWRVNRTSRTSWSSPVIWKNNQRTELIVCGSGFVTSYEPSTGKELWTLAGMGGAFSASPTFDLERIYLGNSGRMSRGPLVAVSAGAAGDLDMDSTDGKGVAWVEDAAGPGMCSPVVVAGRIYVLSRGILSCHDAATGERVYRQRMQNASSVTASLWATNDKLFVLNESGATSVVKVGDEFELLGSNEIEGLFWATPSVAKDSLLLRGAAYLHCIRK